MKSVFDTLFTVTVLHDYYGGPWSEVDYILSPATETLLKKLRLSTKSRDGVLHVFGPVPRAHPLAPVTFSFGLKSNNPYFSNFTALSVAEDDENPRVISFRIPEQLPGDLTKPISLKPHIENPEADLFLANKNFPATTEDDTARRVLRHKIEALKQDVHALLSHGVFAIVAFSLSQEIANAAPPGGLALQIRLNARTIRLNYRVLATGYSDADLKLLAVEEVDFALDERKAPFAFDIDHGTPAASWSSSKLVSFSSKTPIPRKASYRSKFQLRRDGDVLISSLRRPTESQPDGTVLIPIFKT